jgi:dCMP deaminase
MSRPSRDQTMLKLASTLAERSTCGRRQVGCVFTDVHGRVLSMGHNGVAKGQQHCTENPCPGASCPSGTGLDLCQAIHAEQNALMFCSDVMKIHSIYITASPCVHCVKMLLNTSAQEIHFIEEYPHGDAKKLWQGKIDGDSLCSERRWIKHG